MTDPLLEDFLEDFSRHSDSLLPLPQDASARQSLFTQAKVAVRSALGIGDLQRAQRIVAWAWQSARQAVDQPDVMAWAHWCEGLYCFHREPRQALEHLQAARNFYQQAGRAEEEGRVLPGLAALLAQTGQLDAAYQAMQRAIELLHNLPEYPDWPVVYLNLSDILGRRGDFAAMLASAEQAEAMARRWERPAFQVPALINQGYAALLLGQLDLAETRFAEARRLWPQVGFAELAGRLAVDLGRLEVQRGDLFAALKYFYDARQAFLSAEIEMEQAEVAKEEARLYEQLMMLPEARSAAVFAAQTFEHSGLPEESLQAWLSAARLALTLGEAQRARRCLESAAGLLDQVAPYYRALHLEAAAHPLLNPGKENQRAALQRIDTAVEALSQAGMLGARLHASASAAQIASALRMPEARTRYLQLAQDARVGQFLNLERDAYIGLAALSRTPEALTWQQKAVEIAIHQRQNMPVVELKANLLSGQTGLYSRLIELQVRQGQPYAAAEMLLQAKGGSWTDLAVRALTTEVSQATDAEWLSERSALQHWQELARAADDRQQAQAYEIKADEAQERLAEVARRRAQPSLAFPQPTLAEVQQAISPAQCVIEYLVGEKHLLACVLREQQLFWIELCAPLVVEQTQARLRLMLQQLSLCAPGAARRSAAHTQQPLVLALLRQLYEVLVAPLAAHLPTEGQLVIAPDRLLYDIPWAALAAPQGWLGEVYELSLLPSAVLLAASLHPEGQQRTVQVGQGLVLGCAGEPPLAFAEQEVQTIHRVFPDAACIFPARLEHLNLAAAPPFLHITAHGRMQGRTPLLSSLELADGPFLLAEALNLPLHSTRWVTLSACETAAAPQRGGVLLALAGAFLLAGSRTVLASLWNVDDESTGFLMETLYGELALGQSLPCALRLAQNALRQRGFSHPYDWAAFQPLVRCLE